MTLPLDVKVLLAVGVPGLPRLGGCDDSANGLFVI